MSIVCFILVVAFLFTLLGDLSLITSTDLRVNWAPIETFEDMITRTAREHNNKLDNWEVFEDPTALVEPLHVSPVAPKEAIVALEVSPVPLRQRLFGRPEAVYFV